MAPTGNSAEVRGDHVANLAAPDKHPARIIAGRRKPHGRHSRAGGVTIAGVEGDTKGIQWLAEGRQPALAHPGGYQDSRKFTLWFGAAKDKKLRRRRWRTRSSSTCRRKGPHLEDQGRPGALGPDAAERGADRCRRRSVRGRRVEAADGQPVVLPDAIDRVRLHGGRRRGDRQRVGRQHLEGDRFQRDCRRRRAATASARSRSRGVALPRVSSSRSA